MKGTGTAPSAEEWRWKVQSAADTLLEAQKIQTDAKLLKAARAELRKRQAAIAKALPGEGGRKFLTRRGKRK